MEISKLENIESISIQRCHSCVKRHVYRFVDTFLNFMKSELCKIKTRIAGYVDFLLSSTNILKLVKEE